MTDDRDTRLGGELARLQLPGHRAGFWERVEAGVATEAGTLYARRGAELGAALAELALPRHGDEYWAEVTELLETEASALRLPRRRRWPRVVAAAAAAAAATFLVAAWFGLPGSIGGADSALARGFLSPLQTSVTPATLDGDTLFWTSRRAPDLDRGRNDVNIFALDLAGGRPYAVSAFPSFKQQVTSSHGLVAWVDDRDGRPAVYTYEVGSRVERRVAYVASRRPAWAEPLAGDRDSAHLGEPAVSGMRVVWTDADGNVHGYDLGRDTAFRVAQASWPEREPAISGDLVVWSDGRGNTWGMRGRYMNGWEIWSRDLASGRSRPICEAKGDQIAPAVSGNVIVWQDGRNRTTADPDNWDIYGFDLATASEFEVSTAPGPQTNPAVEGGLVVWTDADDRVAAAGGTAASTTIRGFDLRSGRSFAVSDEPGILDFPSISHNRVVWSALGGDGEMAVYGATIVQRGSTVRSVPLQP